MRGIARSEIRTSVVCLPQPDNQGFNADPFATLAYFRELWEILEHKCCLVSMPLDSSLIRNQKNTPLGKLATSPTCKIPHDFLGPHAPTRRLELSAGLNTTDTLFKMSHVEADGCQSIGFVRWSGSLRHQFLKTSSVEADIRHRGFSQLLFDPSRKRHRISVGFFRVFSSTWDQSGKKS